ncbi:MAG: DUF1232 domain-containing protein [Synergistales bacterium]|nr:DUF1232 domain-containing protein [Synergistales bacterium]MDY6401750.1 DUF1232 domain-containing protein [Synergistales bacterium]MDY6404558.1 DUF1232 domain-containing protein [Synergistales bacterium]MDY6411184.1 DUF1232 domain-containing protein [Synergistales bacterium]MDY6413618.1 DUF1232 domain-containing protein [Synergistales bacterium]
MSEDNVIDVQIVGEKYVKNFSEDGFWEKVSKVFKSAGLEVIYKAAQLYYVMKKPGVPIHIKAAIMATLGYFILPFDIIPDFIPVAGYSDDLAAIGAALVMANFYVDENVKMQAREIIDKFFGAGTSNNLD